MSSIGRYELITKVASGEGDDAYGTACIHRHAKLMCKLDQCISKAHSSDDLKPLLLSFQVPSAGSSRCWTI